MSFTRLITAFLCVLLILGFSFNSGIYYENEGDVALKMYANGLLTGMPVALPETYTANNLIGDFTCFLQRLYPTVEWYGVVSVLLSSVILLSFFYLLTYSTLYHYPGFINCFFILGFLVHLLIESFLIQDITRQTMYLVVSVYCILLMRHQTKLFQYLLLYVVLCIACLRRVDIHLITAALSGGFGVLLYRTNRFTIKTVLLPLSFSLLLALIVYHNADIASTTQGHYYKIIRPYENMIIDLKPDTGLLRFKSEKERVIYHTASSFFFADTAIINKSFFNSIGLQPFERTPLQSVFTFQHKQTDTEYLVSLFHEFWINSKWYLVFSIMGAIAIIIICASINKMYEGLLFVVVYYLMLIYINVFLKQEQKFNEPYLFFVLPFLVVLKFKIDIRIRFKMFLNLLLLGISITLLTSSYYNFINYKQRKSDSLYFDGVLQSIAKLPEGSLAMLNIGTWDNLSIPVINNKILSVKTQLASLDNAVLYMYPEYDFYIRSITGQSSFINQIHSLSLRGNVYWYSTKPRIEMLERYLNTVYGMNFRFTLINSIDAVEPDPKNYSEVGIYKLSLNAYSSVK